MNCAHKHCCRLFKPNSPAQRYCSTDCRHRAYHGAGLTPEMRVKRPPRPKGRPARCKWCRGAHPTDKCPGMGATLVKRYGTVVDGRYVPPPGLEVRVLSIPTTVHGDTLAYFLKELDR